MRVFAVLTGAGVLALLLAVFLFGPASLSPVMADDDHGNIRSQATALPIGGGAVTGNIDAALLMDKDYFRFSAQRGVRYTFSLEMVSVEAANIAIINSKRRGTGLADGQVLSQNGRQKSVTWIARTTDPYFIEVSGVKNIQGGGAYLGSYRLSGSEELRLKDRYSDNSTGATALQIGYKYEGAISPWPAASTGSSGGIEEDYDQDYFHIQARRGIKYTFSTLLHGLQGVEIFVADDHKKLLKSNGGNGSTLEWVAPDSGKYYVVLTGSRSLGGSVGGYVLEVSADESLEDIHSFYRDAATLVVPGNQTHGALSPEGDEDYFTFRAERGIEYQVSMSLGGINATNVSLTVYNDDGDLQKSNQGVGTSMSWTPATTEDYFLLVKSSKIDRNPIRAYVLQITADASLEDRHTDSRASATQARLSTPQSGAISPPTDQDYFYFDAVRGVGYNITMHSSPAAGISLSLLGSTGDVEETATNFTAPMHWVAPSNGKYYVLIEAAPGITNVVGPYSFSIVADFTLQDRHADTRQQATAANIGAPHLAAISPADDRDYFSFNAKRGVQYTITVESEALSGVQIAVSGQSGDVDLSNNGVGNNLVWVAPRDGTFYLSISNTGLEAKSVGSYSLRIDASTAYEDLYGETAGSATPLSFEITYPGAISPVDDKDYFYFQAKRGAVYRVNAGPDAPISIAILDHRNEVQARNAGQTYALDWTAPGDGKYYLSLSAPTGVVEEIRNYTLQVLVQEATEDKHSERASQATAVVFGNNIGGAVSPADDIDRFSFNAARGVQYTFELTYGTAKAVSLTLGTRASPDTALASNYGEDKTVTWLAPDSGTYVITISSAPQLASPTGTYSLRVVADDSLTDQHPNTVHRATEIPIGNTVGGSISPADDIDAFVFYAQQGGVYLVKVHTIAGPVAGFTVSSPSSTFSKSQYEAGDMVMVIAPNPGAYHILVSAATPASSTGSKYQVTVMEDAFSPKVDPVGIQAPQLDAIVSTLAIGVEPRVAPKGSIIRVPVVLQNAVDLKNLAFSISFDPALLEVLDVEAGFLGLAADMQYSASEPGMVRIGYKATQPVTGDGQVAVVVFRVIAEEDGAAILSPTLSIATNSQDRLLSTQPSDGQLTIGPRPPGDGSGDGMVTALDALVAMKMANGLQELDLALDIDGDGQVTRHDAMQILTIAGAVQEV